MFKLVIQDDEGKTTIVPLIRDEITIGRKEGNTIRLTERNVSRRHARILRNNGEVHIEDLGSYNGIRVNNARIAERVSLRVSDQVQIGDYKLYLKAEGLDQVDDTRTTPVERVEATATPTEAMPAVAPIVTPAPVIPAVPTVPPMISSPNRAIVSVDPDPGRPGVGPATAAAVQALNTPSGYAKLVVLSSNFAGKEFELSRPQMIIGRTDENDIVVNHRSISRNHAKLVREPDSGRYTISDLQSSNGVRVNGSDYGKVELRRGDVIDLGHVRLRFVEVGEDFVFARDAVITDVPDAGGRRGMVIAVFAALVVLVAGVVVYVMRTGSNSHATPEGEVHAGGPGSDSDTPMAEHTLDAGSAAVVPTQPQPTPSGPGSAAAVDDSAAPQPVQPGAVKSDDIKACVELEVKQKWQELHDCAAELAVRGAAAKDKAIHDKAEEFRQKAVRETAAAIATDKFQAAVRDGNLREGQKQLRAIGVDSVYYAASSETFRAAETRAIDDNRRKAAQYASAHDCTALRRLQAQLGASSTPAVTGAVAAVKCSDKVTAAPGEVTGRPQAPGGSSSGDSAGQTGAKNPCDSMVVDDLVLQAQNQFTAGFARSALQLIVKALTCKQEVRMYRYAVTYACTAHDAASAKLYFSKVPPAFQPPLIQKCQLENITVP